MDQTYAGPNVDLKPGRYVVLAIGGAGMGMDPETVTPAQQGSETSLVLEDETRVRKLVCEVLAGRGYHESRSVPAQQ